jgi:hypothetical protein
MLREALEFLTDQAVNATAPYKLDIPDPKADRYIVQGNEITIPKPKQPRAHRANALGDLVELANRFGKPAVVWYDLSRVVLVIDDDGHRVETVGMSLIASDVFKTIQGLRHNKSWMDQKTFCRLLRLDLSSALAVPELLSIVKNVKFEAGVATTGVINRTKESMGKEIMSSVATIEREIPETVRLAFSLYTTPGTSVDVTIFADVDVDPTSGSFRLIPCPDAIENAQQATMEWLAGELGTGLTDGIPFYYGSP